MTCSIYKIAKIGKVGDGRTAAHLSSVSLITLYLYPINFHLNAFLSKVIGFQV
jgi:hypothetical protein